MADINDLATQIAFLEAGGKPAGTSGYERFTQGFDAVKNIGDTYLGTIKKVLENKKTKIETDKIAQESRPAGHYEQIPSVQEEEAQKQNASQLLGNYNQQVSDFKTQPGVPPNLSAEELHMKTGLTQPAPFASKRKEFTERTGMDPDISIPMNVQKSLYGLRGAQTEKITGDPSRKSMGELFPAMDDAMLQGRFGAGITRETPYVVALGLGKLNIQKSRAERMFPVSSLSPEGQAAARASGLPDYIPESTARIINGANTIKLPSMEESLQVTTAQTIQDKINQL